MGGGLDDFDNEEMTEEKNDRAAEVIDLNEERKKRKPFHYWKVGNTEYKLKLDVETICKLEDKLKKSLIEVLDSTPPLSSMLTIIQGAMRPWHHGIKYDDVKKIYAKWIEEGGSQAELFTKVVIPTMAVSGFFPEKNTQAILEEIEEQ